MHNPTLLHLCKLLCLFCLLCSTLHLECFCASFSGHPVIPPPEATRVVSNKLLVVYVVMFSTGPEWQKVVQAPWELISRMSINGLEQTEDDPEIHGENVQIFCNGAIQNWRANSAKT